MGGRFHGYLGRSVGRIDRVLALVSGGERAIQNDLLDSGLYVLVEGCAILSDREHWKRAGVARERMMNPWRNLSPEEAGRWLDIEPRGDWARDLNGGGCRCCCCREPREGASSDSLRLSTWFPVG